MTHHDNLQRFIFEHANIRGQIVRLHQSFTTIMEQHHYPELIRQLLGETILASVLLSSTIKFQGELTIQFQSEGLVKLLVAKCDNDFHIRGLAQFDTDAVIQTNEKTHLLGAGQLVITIQPETSNTPPYQSIIELEHKPIAETLELYFGRSEQIPTKIWLVVEKNYAVGMLLQLLPEQPSKDREDFWQHAVTLGSTVKPSELLKLENSTLLHRLFPSEDLRLFDPQLVKFQCTCNTQKMERAIYILGKHEATDILTKNQLIEVTCEYCNHSYNFDKVDVAGIFKKFGQEKS